jgi:type II secretory pathway pseudopilin PulG
MMYHFRNLKLKTQNSKLKTAFSLVESVTALIILALISSSVLVVINRSVASAADSTLRMQAFAAARDNMEKLLASSSVKEMAEYGNLENHPEIQWQTVVETFYEPITKRMWIQAVCSAEYTDTNGELQTVELTHWLTDLSKKDVFEILEEKKREKERLDEQGEGEQEGEQEGEDEQEDEQKDEQGEDEQEDEQDEDEEMICGYTMEELEQMDIGEILRMLSDCGLF